MTVSITGTIARYLEALEDPRKVWIAYSGGVDSHVLLYACSQLQLQFPQITFQAVHVHHGLNSQADDWVEHCQNICDELTMPLLVIKIDVSNMRGESLEECARKARYDAFKTLMQSGDCLFTAHHQDDQAETSLLQFLRGAGVKGLAAMPEKIPFSTGSLIRPFLHVSRAELLAFAEENDFEWIEDDSNHDERFTRNYLRYHIMPLLQERWPHVGKTIARVAQHCAEADCLLQEFAQIDIQKCRGCRPNTLSISALRQLTFLRQKNVLREWLVEQHFRLPNTKKLHQLIQDVFYAKQDAQPLVTWQGCEIRRFQDDLFALVPVEQIAFDEALVWTDFKEPYQLPGELGRLYLIPSKGTGISAEKLNHLRQLVIRFRAGGERIQLFDQAGHHSLKKLLNAWRVPPWERQSIPLIYDQDQLVAIGDYVVERAYKASLESDGFLIRWEKR